MDVDEEEAGPSRVKMEEEFLYKEEDDLFEHDNESDAESYCLWNEESELQDDDNKTINDFELMAQKEFFDESKTASKSEMAEDKQTISWSTTSLNIKSIPFMGRPGFLVTLPINAKPIDYFFTLVDDNFFELLCDETNIHAEEIFLQKGQGRIAAWRDVTKDELLKFLGLLLHMGTIRCPKILDYWKTHRLFSIPCFSQYMKRDRFLLILNCLNFARNPRKGEPIPEDHMFKIRPVLNYFNTKMETIYGPQKQLYLDEPMTLYKGRLSFHQYSKDEKEKYGLKLYMLSDSAGIILNLAAYTGIMNSLGLRDHLEHVVLNLMQNKLYKGYSLYMNSLYNGLNLATQLLRLDTYSTGPLRAGKKCISDNIAKAKLGAGETICHYAHGVFIIKWHDKQDIMFISTEHSNEMVRAPNQRGQSKYKPKAVVEYNSYKPSTDYHEQILFYYPFCNKTQWHKKVCLHIIHMMVLNAFLLYNKYTNSKLSFYDFRMSLVEELLPEDTASKMKPPTQNLDLEHFPSKCPKIKGKRILRKRCKQCSSKGIRKDSQYLCKSCPGTPGLCLEPCFIQFHKNSK